MPEINIQGNSVTIADGDEEICTDKISRFKVFVYRLNIGNPNIHTS
jgi:hypothetical protein